MREDSSFGQWLKRRGFMEIIYPIGPNLTADYTDFADRNAGAGTASPLRQIRVIREIRGYTPFGCGAAAL